MTEVAPHRPQNIKRFYKDVTIAPVTDEAPGCFAILLDGRKAKSPAGKVLSAPHKLAQEIMQEWAAQAVILDFATMPLTRLYMTVLDASDSTITAWRETPKRFLGTDLLTYRAERPDALRAREDEVWDLYCDWAKDIWQLEIPVTSGVVAVAPKQVSLERIQTLTKNLPAGDALILALACELTGSAILSLALYHGFTTTGDIFEASQLDELFQEQAWGQDAEASQRRTMVKEDLETLAKFLSLLTPVAGANPES